jgi:AAA family ATP:ADP antiporter
VLEEEDGARSVVGRVLVSATVLGLVLAAHTILEVARDALFLSRLPPSQLPFTYLAIAAAAVGVAQLDRHVLGRLDRRALTVGTLAVAAAGAVAFQALFALPSPLVTHAFYVWTGLVSTLAVTQLWGLAADRFTVTEAKRAYSWIAAGGSVGAVGGAFLATRLSAFVGPRSLLYVGAALFALAAVAVARSTRPEGPRSVEVPQGPQDAAPNRAYLRWILALVFLSAASATVIDFLFKDAVSASVDADALAAFFGRFHTALNVISLLVQLTLAPRLLRALGASRAYATLPVLLSLGAVAAVVQGGLAATALLRGTDSSLRHSLTRSALELLQLPLPRAIRDRNKAWVDALGQRGGQAAASLALLAAVSLSLDDRVIAVGLAAVVGTWLLLATRIRRRYVDLFRRNLAAGSIESRVDVPALDLSSLESLVASLNSERDEEVLATLGLLKHYERVHLVPSLLLYHPSEPVVLRVLELFAARRPPGFEGPARRLLKQGATDEIRAAAMRALAVGLAPQELQDILESELPTATRASALVALASRGGEGSDAAREELDKCSRSADRSLRLAVARALRLQGDPTLGRFLRILAEDDPPSWLQAEIARGLAACKPDGGIDLAIAWVADREVRGPARDALVAYGAPALAALREAMADPSLPRRLRGHLPRTVSRFVAPEAARLLLERLDVEPDGWVRYKILRGLRPLREAFPNLDFDARRLADHLGRDLRRGTAVRELRLAFEATLEAFPERRTRGAELLRDVLWEKEEQALQRAVRLVALAHPKENLTHIRHALRRGDRRLRAEGRELLSHLAPAGLAEALDTLLDDRERPPSTSRPPPDPDEVLRRLLIDSSESVRSMAVFHVGELGATELTGLLEEARAGCTRELGEVIDRVLEELAGERMALGSVVR